MVLSIVYTLFELCSSAAVELTYETAADSAAATCNSGVVSAVDKSNVTVLLAGETSCEGSTGYGVCLVSRTCGYVLEGCVSGVACTNDTARILSVYVTNRGRIFNNKGSAGGPTCKSAAGESTGDVCIVVEVLNGKGSVARLTQDSTCVVTLDSSIVSTAVYNEG